VGWIQLIQDRDQWWVPVKMVMKLLVPLERGNFLTSCVIISFSISGCLFVFGWLVG
jgi:hypothetical protein